MLAVFKGRIEGYDVRMLQLAVYPDFPLHLQGTSQMLSHTDIYLARKIYTEFNRSPGSLTWYQLSCESRAFL